MHVNLLLLQMFHIKVFLGFSKQAIELYKTNININNKQ